MNFYAPQRIPIRRPPSGRREAAVNFYTPQTHTRLHRGVYSSFRLPQVGPDLSWFMQLARVWICPATSHALRAWLFWHFTSSGACAVSCGADVPASRFHLSETKSIPPVLCGLYFLCLKIALPRGRCPEAVTMLFCVVATRFVASPFIPHCHASQNGRLRNACGRGSVVALSVLRQILRALNVSGESPPRPTSATDASKQMTTNVGA